MVIRDETDAYADAMFAEAYGRSIMYSPQGLKQRPGVARTETVAKKRARNPSGTMSEIADIVARDPSAIAASSVKPSTGIANVTGTRMSKAKRALSRVRAYQNKLRTGK